MRLGIKCITNDIQRHETTAEPGTDSTKRDVEKGY